MRSAERSAARVSDRKDGHDIVPHAIDDDVWRPRNDEFAGLRQSAGSALKWQVSQVADTVEKTVDDAPCAGWAFDADMRGDLDKLAASPRGEGDLQSFNPSAAQTSSLE